MLEHSTPRSLLPHGSPSRDVTRRESLVLLAFSAAIVCAALTVIAGPWGFSLAGLSLRVSRSWCLNPRSSPVNLLSRLVGRQSSETRMSSTTSTSKSSLLGRTIYSSAALRPARRSRSPARMPGWRLVPCSPTGSCSRQWPRVWPCSARHASLSSACVAVDPGIYLRRPLSAFSSPRGPMGLPVTCCLG